MRQSQERLKKAQSVARIGSWHLDIGENVLTWSEETYRIFGIPDGAPLTYGRFLEAVHPEDRERVELSWKAALRGSPYDIEHRILVNGKIKWVREKANVAFEGNKAIGAIGIAQDITEKKNTEAENQKLQQQLKKYTTYLEKNFNTKPTLSKTEKVVLSAIVFYPDYSDIQLSEITNLKRSTITAIRNRLQERKCFSYQNIPRLSCLEQSLLIVVHLPNRWPEEAKDHVEKNPSFFFGQTSDSFSYVLSLFKDATEMSTNLRELFSLFGSDLLSTVKKEVFTLPFTINEIMLCVHEAVNTAFGTDFQPPVASRQSDNELKESEKRIFFALVKHPNATFEELQKITGFSKPTLIKVKNFLFKNGFLKRAVIPSFNLMNLSFFSFCVGKGKIDMKNSFWAVRSVDLSISLNAYSSYSQMEKSLMEGNQSAAFPFQNPEILTFDLKGIVGKAFGQNE